MEPLVLLREVVAGERNTTVVAASAAPEIYRDKTLASDEHIGPQVITGGMAEVSIDECIGATGNLACSADRCQRNGFPFQSCRR